MGTPSENVFAPPKSNVVDVQSGDEAEKASRGIRLLAKILDGVAYTIGFLPTYIAVFPHYMSSAAARSGNPFQIWAAMAQTGGRFYLGMLVSLVVIVQLLGGFYALADFLFIFGSARRCVHDYIADTIVVRA